MKHPYGVDRNLENAYLQIEESKEEKKEEKKKEKKLSEEEQ